MAIHWCGTGLSSIPGLKKLILDGNNVIVWNRTVSKARKALEGVQVQINEFDMNALGEKFDLRDFHSIVLDHGIVPLFVLEDLIDQWIEESLSV